MKKISILAVLIAALGLPACANTIKGVGKDAANTVDATKAAGEDVAKAVVYLADPNNTFVTGQTINVNGGWSRKPR